MPGLPWARQSSPRRCSLNCIWDTAFSFFTAECLCHLCLLPSSQPPAFLGRLRVSRASIIDELIHICIYRPLSLFFWKHTLASFSALALVLVLQRLTIPMHSILFMVPLLQWNFWKARSPRVLSIGVPAGIISIRNVKSLVSVLTLAGDDGKFRVGSGGISLGHLWYVLKGVEEALISSTVSL